jgi:hypothetical protein
LHEDSRSKVLLRIPPIRRARSGTASTQDAFVHTIQFLSVLGGLEIFLVLITRLRSGQPGLNTFVLIIKVTHIGHEIL